MGAFIDVGEVSEVAKFKHGENAKGPWELMVIKDQRPKGFKKINIWPSNAPTGFQEGDKVKVLTITHVSYVAEKLHDGRWIDKVDVYAEVEPIHDTEFDPFADDGYTDDVEEMFPL